MTDAKFYLRTCYDYDMEEGPSAYALLDEGRPYIWGISWMWEMQQDFVAYTDSKEGYLEIFYPYREGRATSFMERGWWFVNGCFVNVEQTDPPLRLDRTLRRKYLERWLKGLEETKDREWWWHKPGVLEIDEESAEIWRKEMGWKNCTVEDLWAIAQARHSQKNQRSRKRLLKK